MATLETLRQLMPPTAESDTSVDWARMSESWGKAFPSDFRYFIEAYGAGTIEDCLSVLRPEPRGAESGTDDMLMETVNAESAWTREPKSADLVDASPELIAWGLDSSSDILCWDASGDDPESWPVLVRSRGDNLWSRYDCGMVEFLVRVLRAGFADCPLSDVSLWGKGHADFLNQREYQRRLKAGSDPWTGEPDPYADMFAD
ncbi:SMI1/KNR4 family protein [Streptomyces sp. NPDC102282]|uniref:SMI1/KNR4 family protein n=1 Tax=Streptomyces sp. NPDC102282 TaxID=3366154 RepID=UPI00381FC5A0